MLNIIPGPHRIVPPENLNYPFTVSHSNVQKVVEASGWTPVEEKDVIYEESTTATVRNDGQIEVSFREAGALQIQFYSENQEVADVDATGYITAKGNGVAAIVVTDGRYSKTVYHEAAIRTPVVARRFASYVDGSLGKAVWDAATARAAGVTNSAQRNVFTSRASDGTAFVRNPGVWSEGFNWTGASPWNSTGRDMRGGTLVTPRHLVFCSHMQFYPVIGARIVFVAEDNTVVERTLVAREHVTGDVQLGLLDEDVPEGIKFYEVLPSDVASYVTVNGIAQVPILYTERQRKAAASMWVTSKNGLHTDPEEAPLSGVYEPLISGDSGQPLFLTDYDGLEVFLGVHTSLGSFTLFNDFVIGAVNAKILALGDDGNYQLTRADFSNYPTF